jgi:hypothetical protein
VIGFSRRAQAHGVRGLSVGGNSSWRYNNRLHLPNLVLLIYAFTICFHYFEISGCIVRNIMCNFDMWGRCKAGQRSLKNLSSLAEFQINAILLYT